MTDYLKDLGKYTIGPVLAVGLLLAALRLSGPITVVSPAPAIPAIPVVVTVPESPPKPPEPPPKITRSFITKNDEAIPAELEAKLNQALDSGAIGEYQYVGYPESGKVRRKRIIIEDLDAPTVIVKPSTPSTPNTPSTPSTPPVVSPGVIVTYVHEKDDKAVPSAVQAGIYRLTRDKGVTLASAFEKDSKNGSGVIPPHYKRALDEALKVGLPALVVEKDGKTLNVIKDPQTEESVFNSVN